MDLPKRKQNRLANYKYSQNGYYFITICTKDKEKILGQIPHFVGDSCAVPQPKLSPFGEIVNMEIQMIGESYRGTVRMDAYVIMPNHVHMILVLEQMENDNGRPQVAPTVSRIMQQWKGSITKQIGHSIWQKSFHDHIIRNEKEYLKILEYIETNPLKWELDCYYINEI